MSKKEQRERERERVGSERARARERVTSEGEPRKIAALKKDAHNIPE